MRELAFDRIALARDPIQDFYAGELFLAGVEASGMLSEFLIPDSVIIILINFMNICASLGISFVFHALGRPDQLISPRCRDSILAPDRREATAIMATVD